MNARTSLGVLALVFFGAAALRLLRDRGRLAQARKVWLLVGVIFALVSAWLARADVS
jgi:undecaprenyl pyrophosphate phosphatase UppP